MSIRFNRIVVLSFLSSFSVDAFTQSDQKDKVPIALKRALAARDQGVLYTAKIEWAITEPELVGQDSIGQYFTWRCAGNDIASLYRGNEEGEVLHVANGDHGNYSKDYRGAEFALKKDDKTWVHRDGSSRAVLRNDDRPGAYKTFDLRRLGLNPARYYESLDRILEEFPGGELSYSASTEGELEKVVVSYSGGGWDDSWSYWIDPQKGWSVVRMQSASHGKPNLEERFELASFDGYWFPVKAEYFRVSDLATPYRTIDILEAEFNRPDHPQELTPADIGIEPGTFVTMRGATAPPYLKIWSGTDLVTADEFRELLNSGTVAKGPTIKRNAHQRMVRRMKREGGPFAHDRFASEFPTFMTSKLSKWEQYTYEHIRQFELDEGQSETAFRILEDCQEQAASYLEKRRDEFAKADETIRMLVKGNVASSDGRMQKALAERDELLLPIDKIFQSKLKPRLDELPTKKQREAAKVKIK